MRLIVLQIWQHDCIELDLLIELLFAYICLPRPKCFNFEENNASVYLYLYRVTK